jgi:putative colanic acid biosynthesis acetyltransferase WcaF
MEPLRNLAAFSGAGYDKGRSRIVQAAWFATMNLVFSAWWCPGRVRVTLLRAFGARVGENVLIRHRVRVLWPWKLSVGDNCWIGEGAWILNLEPVTLGHDVCVSQEAFLCAGSHDPRSATFEFDNGPISIDDGAWIGARATVLRRVSIGRGAVVPAGAVVRKDIPAVEDPAE